MLGSQWWNSTVGFSLKFSIEQVLLAFLPLGQGWLDIEVWNIIQCKVVVPVVVMARRPG